VGGPLLGGFLITAGFVLSSIFFVLAGLALLGVVLTLLVPVARRTHEITTIRVEPTSAKRTPVPS
jgi:AAHS family benzoate transporter-like MFS transporter